MFMTVHDIHSIMNKSLENRLASNVYSCKCALVE